MERKSESMNYVKYTLQDLDFGEKTENVKNESQTLYDLEYGKKH